MILNVSDRSVTLSQTFSVEDRQFKMLNMDSELLSAHSHSEVIKISKNYSAYERERAVSYLEHGNRLV